MIVTTAELYKVVYGKAALLESVQSSGSISAAARAMGMDYKRAWLLVDSLNRAFDTPVVERVTERRDVVPAAEVGGGQVTGHEREPVGNAMPLGDPPGDRQHAWPVHRGDLQLF